MQKKSGGALSHHAGMRKDSLSRNFSFSSSLYLVAKGGPKNKMNIDAGTRPTHCYSAPGS